MKKILLFLFLTSSILFAHSGRTDSKGGHHTKNCDHNRGVCYYHYH